MIDSASGNALIFERILPEDGVNVCRFRHGEQDVPFLARLTWEQSKPPRAVWLVEHIGKNLLGILSIDVTRIDMTYVRENIELLLVNYSRRLGVEFDGVSVRFSDTI